MIACPWATRQRTIRRSVSSGAWTTRPRLSAIVRISPFRAGSTTGSTMLDQDLHLVEDRLRNLLFRCFRNPPLSGCGQESDLVVGGVEADIRPRHVVEDEEVGALAGELLPRAFETILPRLGGEAAQKLGVEIGRASWR